MNRNLSILLHVILIGIAIGAFGCGQEAPPAQPPKTVSKKINTQPVQPQATPGQAQQTASQEAASQEGAGESKAAQSAASPEEAAPAESQLVQESLQMASSYDATGRFDPFEPLFKEQAETQAVTSDKARREKRIPQTPLEKVALSQLKLTAIIRAPSGNRALVEDSTGKGYVISKGTYIGLNSGRVIEIGRDKVLVEEEIENVMGEIEIQNEELKLQKPAGEL